MRAANAEPRGIFRLSLSAGERLAAQARLIDDARDFAVRRVQSTVCQLGGTHPEQPEQRMLRLLEFVAWQEPRWCRAVGIRDDDTAVLATDLAYGWIPPRLELPAGVSLPAPGRLGGGATALLGGVTLAASYRPGD